MTEAFGCRCTQFSSCTSAAAAVLPCTSVTHPRKHTSPLWPLPKHHWQKGDRLPSRSLLPVFPARVWEGIFSCISRRVLGNQHSHSRVLTTITKPATFLLLFQESKTLTEILSNYRFPSRKIILTPRSF